MSDEVLHAVVEACDEQRKLILALLALAGEPMGRRRLHEHLAPLEASTGEQKLAEPMERLPMVDFSSGYVKRAEGMLPAQGPTAPWRVHQNYVRDLAALRFGRVDDGTMEFSRAG